MLVQFARLRTLRILFAFSETLPVLSAQLAGVVSDSNIALTPKLIFQHRTRHLLRPSFMSRNVDSKVYEFNGFRLEAAQRRLLYEGQSVPLKPKIFDLLLFLIEMRGQLVVKEDLMREIWPDAIVEENNITVSMSILRKTLGDHNQKRQFIETVPRRGYRFFAEVTEIPLAQTATVEVRQSRQSNNVTGRGGRFACGHTDAECR